MGDWLDLLAFCVNEWMRRKWLEYDMSYNVYVHYSVFYYLQSTFLVDFWKHVHALNFFATRSLAQSLPSLTMVGLPIVEENQLK